MDDLEKEVAKYVESIRAINSTIRKRIPIEVYADYLEEKVDFFARKYMEQVAESAKHEFARKHLFEGFKALVTRSMKFIGKKVSAENLELYHEIDSEHDKIKKEYGDLGYKVAVDKVATKRRKNAKNLYARYMKWKISRHVKST